MAGVEYKICIMCCVSSTPWPRLPWGGPAVPWVGLPSASSTGLPAACPHGPGIACPMVFGTEHFSTPAARAQPLLAPLSLPCCCSPLAAAAAAPAGINFTCSLRRTSLQTARPVAAAPKLPQRPQQRPARPMLTAKQQPAQGEEQQQPARHLPVLQQQQRRQHQQRLALHLADRQTASRSATSVAARATPGTAASSPSASAASSSGM